MKLLSIFLILSLVLCPVIGADTVFSGPVGLKNLSVSSGDTAVGTDYSDIIFHHILDAKGDATKSSGVGTVSWGSVLLDTSVEAVGTGCIDQNDDNNEGYSFAIEDNINFASGRIGFYLRPVNAIGGDYGNICSTNGNDFSVWSNFSPNSFSVTYLGTRGNLTTAGWTVGTWYWVEFKFDGNVCYVYRDNTLIGTVTGTGSVDDTSIKFMSNSVYAYDHYQDQIISTNDIDRNLYAIRDVTDFS